MRGLIVLGVLALAACDGTEGLVLQSTDGGVDGAASDLTSSGGDMVDCPADYLAAEGKSCSPEGKSCSSGCTNPCEFCNSLSCTGGKWQRLEAFPDPSCSTSCHLGHDPLPCTGGTDECASYGSSCDGAKGYCVCKAPACTPGQDQTCNDSPTMSSFAGTCNSFGACECGPNFEWNPQTGKCAFVPCPTNAPVNGATCSKVGQTCSYVPNTTCTCYSGFAGNSWGCAL